MLGINDKRSNFRWVVIILLFILNATSYIDRSSMAYVVKDLMADLHLSFNEMGFILGAFGIGYLIAAFVGGIIVDYRGAKVTILLFTLFWAMAIISTGLAVGFISAYLARFALGLAEGPNFPAAARAVADWLPDFARAKALSNVLVAVPLSLAVGGPLITLILLAFSWRWLFFILAIPLLIWWPFWYFLFDNRPHQSRFVNEKELKYITQNQNQVAEFSRPPSRKVWRFLFKSPTILANNWGFFVFGCTLFFFLSLLPDFLEKDYQLDILKVGLFTFLPWSLGALLLWLGGYLSDYLLKKTGKLRYARTYIILFSQLLSFLCIIPILYWHDLGATLGFISLAIAFSLFANTCFYAINVDIAKQRAASSLGLMTVGFAMSGILSPIIAGWLVQTTGDFYAVFALLAVLTLSSVVITYFFHKPDQAVLF